MSLRWSVCNTKAMEFRTDGFRVMIFIYESAQL